MFKNIINYIGNHPIWLSSIIACILLFCFNATVIRMTTLSIILTAIMGLELFMFYIADKTTNELKEIKELIKKKNDGE